MREGSEKKKMMDDEKWKLRKEGEDEEKRLKKEMGKKLIIGIEKGDEEDEKLIRKVELRRKKKWGRKMKLIDKLEKNKREDEIERKRKMRIEKKEKLNGIDKSGYINERYNRKDIEKIESDVLMKMKDRRREFLI